MTQMILLSTFLHLFFISILTAMPFFKSKKITYTPVYTVDLVSLPVIKAKPSAKRAARAKSSTKRAAKAKSVNLLSGKKKSTALAKLKVLEKKIKQEKTLKNKNEIVESNIPEMLAALDKIAEAENESGLIDDSEERKDKILEELNKLEEEWSKDKNSNLNFEKSKSLEQLKELEKKWQEEAAKLQSFPGDALAKLTAQVPSVSNQNISVTPSYLSIYFAFIKSKAMSQWKNPSGIEILTEKGSNKKTVVSFNIIRSGRIEDYKIDESSGNRVLDDLALEAVKNSDPLPPLPSEYHENFLRVFLDFNYTLK